MTPLPKFDIGNFYADVLAKGFYFFDGSEVLKDFPIQDYKQIPGVFSHRSAPCDDNRHIRRYTELAGAFEDIGQRVSEHFFKGMQHEISFDQFQHAVHPAAHKWHKDPVKTHDGVARPCTLNCYYEDYDPTTGGELQFYEVQASNGPIEDDDPTATGNVSPIAEDDPRICGVYPRKHMIIIINHTSRFLHRVTPLNKGRDLMLFNLDVFGIENV